MKLEKLKAEHVKGSTALSTVVGGRRGRAQQAGGHKLPGTPTDVLPPPEQPLRQPFELSASLGPSVVSRFSPSLLEKQHRVSLQPRHGSPTCMDAKRSKIVPHLHALSSESSTMHYALFAMGVICFLSPSDDFMSS